MGGEYKEYLKKQILALIKKNPNMTPREISEKLPITKVTVEKYIKELIEEGRLKSKPKPPEKIQKQEPTGKAEKIIEKLLEESKKSDDRLTYMEIAKKLGVPYNSVKYYAEKLRKFKKIINSYNNNNDNNNSSSSKNTKKKEDDDELEL